MPGLKTLAVVVATRRHGRPGAPGEAPRPLGDVGLLLGSGGVLRHAEPERALDQQRGDPAAEAGSADAITLAAPGPTQKGSPSGLASLSERIEAVGGTLAAHRKRDDFTVTARVPRPPAPSTEPAQPAPAAIAQTAGEAR